MLPTDEIGADSDTLMRQAPMTVSYYASQIRKDFGDAWCDANPQAFAMLVQAAAIDFTGSVLAREIGRLTKVVSELEPLFDPGAGS